MKGLKEGKRLKKEGMELAAFNRKDWLEYAQAIAEIMASEGEAITIDDVMQQMANPPLGNAAGSVFKGKQWRRVGFKQSARPANHARMVGVWELKR